MVVLLYGLAVKGESVIGRVRDLLGPTNSLRHQKERSVVISVRTECVFHAWTPKKCAHGEKTLS